MLRQFSRVGFALLAGCGVMATAAPADAAGLYFGERGVRPLARGGAFIAGADDLGAIAYNPAGVFDAGEQFLFDASWVRLGSDYTRRAWLEARDPNTGEVVGGAERVYPTVTGSSAVLPLPTFAASFRLRPDLVLAVGAFAPSATIMSYPESLAGKAAPQRYSLITLEGSALGVIGAWAGWKPNEKWRLGAGLEFLVGKFEATTMFSTCLPDRFLCAQEQPEWDTLTQLSAGPIVAPSGVLGAKFNASPKWTLGASFHLPFFVRAPATVKTRLPTTPAFETAVQQGDAASIAFDLPWVGSLGVQYRPIAELAIEAAAAMQGWGMLDAITVTPKDIELRNVVGFPDPYRFPAQRIDRSFRDSVSLRLGGEYTMLVGSARLDVRAGASVESSAVPPESLSVLTLDAPKATVSVGAGLHVGRFRFDAVYAHVFMATTDVDPRDARSPLLVAVQANAVPHYVNGGQYTASGDVVGLGLTYKFGRAPKLPDSVEPARDVEVRAVSAAAREKREPPAVR